MTKNNPAVNIQPVIETENILLKPLAKEDFESLYNAASDPKIWEQHPTKNRWQKEVFKTFFTGAIKSKGAYAIIDKSNDMVIGSTRFYDHKEEEKSIHIGYTFYRTQYWGKGINTLVKSLMLNYIFTYVTKVHFQIGADNIRSQIAISRLGAIKTGEQEVTYYGERPMQNFIYEIAKENWEN